MDKIIDEYGEAIINIIIGTLLVLVFVGGLIYIMFNI